MAFRNLEERFNARVDELYSSQRFPSKESSDLHPIIVRRPGDPNITQGQGDGRIAPVNRTLTDLSRMTKLMTAPQGIKFLLNQEILQLSNAISETRFIDPTFVLKNVAPYEHFKRQLFDQTDVIVNDPARSPASTPLVGLAGRLQTQTAAEATARIVGTDARTSLLDVLGSTVLGRTVTAAFQSLDGTLQVNERPELDVDGRYYASVLWQGRRASLSRELDVLVDAFNVLGLGASILGLPNVIGNILRPAPLPSTRDFRDVQPYFNPDLAGADDAQTYLDRQPVAGRPALALPSVASELVDKIVGLGIAAAVRNLLGLGGISKLSSFTSLADFQQSVAIGPPEPVPPSVLSDVNRSLAVRYAGDPAQTLPPVARAAAADTAAKLAEQLVQLRDRKPSWANELARRGIEGGITLENVMQFEGIDTYEKAQEFRKSLYRTNKRPGYYHDLLNMRDAIEGTAGLSPVKTPVGEEIQDYIKVHFLDVTNNRLIPFRAILDGLVETVTSEYSPTRYIGRIERNIVYLGATRNLSFNLYVNAWSPDELDHVWRKVNTLTGLMYPAKYTTDGFMAPPVVRLTIGDLYSSQPGYISNLVHTIDDGASWETTEGSQVPQRIQMAVTFEVIEKNAMSALSNFYGYLEPIKE